MRISKEEHTYIKKFWTTKVKGSSVFLFGSRVEDAGKGGDIDLLVLTEKNISLDEKMDFMIGFYSRFGEQKLDIVNFF